METHSIEELNQWRRLPLSVKCRMTLTRIRRWVSEYGVENVCVLMTFSPESTVLLYLASSEFPDINVAFGECGHDMKPISAWIADTNNKEIDDWLMYGCNQYDSDQPISKPMAFWEKADVIRFIREKEGDV